MSVYNWPFVLEYHGALSLWKVDSYPPAFQSLLRGSGYLWWV